MNQITVKEVIRNLDEIYRREWRKLLKISAFQVLIAYAILLTTLVVNNVDNLLVSVFVFLIRFLLLIFSLYFINRIRVSLILIASGALNGEKGAVRDYYKRAEKTTWRYMGYRALIVLMFIIPLLLISTAKTLPTMKVFEAPFYVEIILYLLGGISLLVLATLFYYVPAISVMHAKKNGVFGYSVKLVKNNILPIIILIVLALLSPAYTYVNTYLFDVSHYNFFVEVVLGLIKLIPMWFMEPFIVSIPVVALFLTEGGKQEDLNVIVSSKPKNEFDYLQ